MPSLEVENLSVVSHIFPQKTGISRLKRRRPSKPNRWIKAKARATSGANLKDAQRDFFERARDYGVVNAPHIATWHKPSRKNWYDVLGYGCGQLTLLVNTQKKSVTTHFWINHDKELYARLLAQRDAIEADLGFVLEWTDKPDRKASKLAISRPGDFLDEAQSQELVEWLVTTVDAFARVLPKYL